MQAGKEINVMTHFKKVVAELPAKTSGLGIQISYLIQQGAQSWTDY